MEELKKAFVSKQLWKIRRKGKDLFQRSKIFNASRMDNMKIMTVRGNKKDLNCITNSYSSRLQL